MLPFLKNGLKRQQSGGVIVVNREPDMPEQSEQDSSEAALEACAQDLINAIHSKDLKRVAQVLKDAHEICDNYPHEEGPNTDEPSAEEVE